MSIAENQGPRKSSGTSRKSSPGSYAVAESEVTDPVLAAISAEDRIAGIKAYHEARLRLATLAAQLSNAPAPDIIPGVTAAYVEAMRQCLQVLLLNADVAEGL
jgi:hypothetical protein